MAVQKKPLKSQEKNKKGEVPLLATLSHLSILTIFIIGPFSLLIPLIIWLSERSKAEGSGFVEFHAKQAFFYQLAGYLIAVVLAIVIGILSFILIGLLLVPLLILFGLAFVAYGVYAGIRVAQGEDFKYLFISDYVSAG